MAKRKAKLIPTPKASEPKAQPNPLEQTPTDLEEHWADVAPSKRIPRMPRKDLAQFVMDFCDGKLFTSAHLHERETESLLSMIFLPLAMGGLHGLYEGEVKKIGLIWEFFDQAGPRGINGRPMFFSCRIMHKDDWDMARKAIQREYDRRKKATESVLDEELGPAPPEEPEPPHDDSDQDPW